MVNGRRERRAATHLGVVLLQGVIHLEDFRLFAREEARLTDVAVEVSERSVAKAEHGIDFTDVATRFVLRGFAGCETVHDRQPDQGLWFEFDPVEKVLGGDGIRILRLEIASIASVISLVWPCSYVFETALHTRLDTRSTERCDLTEMLWNLRTRAKVCRRDSRMYVRRWRVERDSIDAIDRRRHGHGEGRTRERIYLHVRSERSTSLRESLTSILFFDVPTAQ